MMKINNTVTLAIVTFHSSKIIEKCLRKIGKRYKVLIIDNTYDQEIKKRIQKKYLNCKVILNKNNGYGASANLASKLIKTKYIFFINPDVFIERKTIPQLILSAKLLKNKFAALLPNENNKYKNYNDITETNIIKSSSFFLNRKKFINVGGFDKKIFLYFEEVDLSLKFKKINEKIYIIKNSLIKHLGARSHNKKFNFEIEICRNWHYMWSLFYFKKKHDGLLVAYAITLPKLIRYTIKMCFFFFFNRNKFMKLSARSKGLISSYLNKRSSFRPLINNQISKK
jgi:N-acetylglucosaminyl-diphospho-decaprenol L-rhamnosyltransferase